MKTESENKKRNLLSIKSMLAVALVLIVIANIVVWVNHLNKRSEVESLNGEIALINENIKQTVIPPDGLEKEIESARAALAAATKDFPVSVNRNEVMDFILDTADSCGVQVIPLVSEGWSNEEAGATYRVLGFSGTITGSMSEISDFICELQENSYKTLTIKNISITSRPDLYPDNPTYSNDVPVSVSLSIAVYTCPQTEYKDAV